MAQTVIGIFDKASEAQEAVEQLINKGFTRNNIDVSTQSASNYADNRQDDDDSVGDSIGNFFSNLFGDSDDSKKYSSVARRGSVVTVHAQSADEAEQAADILDECGATDVDERAKEVNYGANAFTKDTTLSDKADNTNASLPVIEEELQVGKRTVQTGGARLRSRIVERPIEESLRLREERVRVERNTVDRPASEAELANFKEGQIEMIERAEVPVVSKEARVVEEISLSKEVEEREETIRDTVRKTEVEVENLRKDGKVDTDSDLNRSDYRQTDEDVRRRSTDS